MKLSQIIQYGSNDNFGKEYYLKILNTISHSFFQISIDICDNEKWITFPYLQISMGHNNLFSLLFIFGKIGISFDLLGLTWYNDGSSNN